VDRVDVIIIGQELSETQVISPTGIGLFLVGKNRARTLSDLDFLFWKPPEPSSFCTGFTGLTIFLDSIGARSIEWWAKDAGSEIR